MLLYVSRWNKIYCNICISRNNYKCYARNYILSQSRVKVMTLNAIFNNISATEWRSVLLVEETGVPE